MWPLWAAGLPLAVSFSRFLYFLFPVLSRIGERGRKAYLDRVSRDQIATAADQRPIR